MVELYHWRADGASGVGRTHTPDAAITIFCPSCEKWKSPIDAERDKGGAVEQRLTGACSDRCFDALTREQPLFMHLTRVQAGGMLLLPMLPERLDGICIAIVKPNGSVKVIALDASISMEDRFRMVQDAVGGYATEAPRQFYDHPDVQQLFLNEDAELLHLRPNHDATHYLKWNAGYPILGNAVLTIGWKVE